MISPPLTLIREIDTHRLIPCKYNVDGQSVLAKIADNDAHLQDLFRLDGATNDRLWAEQDLLPGISRSELVFNVPQNRVINSSFTHARPGGARFNDADRGAWYAGLELGTAQAEVIFHKTQEYAEIGRFHDSVSYDDYLADFSGKFHDLRKTDNYADYLSPTSYQASQGLADGLLAQASLGIIYPSVRKAGGTCLVCFRPALVSNVRKQYRYSLTWTGDPVPVVACTSGFLSQAN